MIGVIGLLKTERQRQDFIIDIPPHWDGMTIEYVLQKVFFVPKKMRHAWRMKHAVRLNTKPVPFHETLTEGDRLFLPVFAGSEPVIKPVPMDIPVLYEDDHLLIVNKKAGLATHPNTPDDYDTLLNGVYHYLKEKTAPAYVQHVHRLDEETTGALLFAKHPLAKSLLDRLFHDRKIVRTYTALVSGKLRRKEGTIRANIGRDRHHPTRRRVSKTGQTAITHYRTLGFDPKRKLTLVECQLETGRTHQIRVHLSYLGHPLAGDTLYGGDPIFPRPALHARSLSFEHPLTFPPVHVVAPYLDEPPIFPAEITRPDA